MRWARIATSSNVTPFHTGDNDLDSIRKTTCRKEHYTKYNIQNNTKQHKKGKEVGEEGGGGGGGRMIW